MSFFPWRADYVLEGLVLTEKMWFLPLISYWEVVKHILIFCGYCFWSRHLPSDARIFIAAKKAHKSRAGRRHVKDQKTSNRVLRADQNSDVNQTCQQSVFTPIGACIRIWYIAGAVERRSQTVCLQSLTLSLSSPREFFNLSPNREPVHRLWNRRRMGFTTKPLFSESFAIQYNIKSLPPVSA